MASETTRRRGGPWGLLGYATAQPARLRVVAFALLAGVGPPGLGACEEAAQNSVVTPEQRETLKQELRAEILAELAAKQAPRGAAAKLDAPPLTAGDRAAIVDARRAMERGDTAPPVIAGRAVAPAPPEAEAAGATTAPPAPEERPAVDPELPPDEDGDNPAVEEPPADAEPASADPGEERAAGVRIFHGPNGIELLELAVGTEIGEREALGVRRVFDTMPDRLFCYTVFDNHLAETTVTHVWRRGTRLVSRVELEVGRSPRWRTWSRQRTRADWTGAWSCEVLDAEGVRLGLVEFEVRSPTGQGSADGRR